MHGPVASDLTLRRGKLADAMPLVMAYHYTQRRTADPMYVFLWERAGSVVAAAIFTSPVNRYFGKGAIELARLVRVPWLEVPISRFVALCIKELKKDEKLQYLLSYADSTVGHYGTIYDLDQRRVA